MFNYTQDLKKMLDLVDDDSDVTDVRVEDGIKTVTIVKRPHVLYCPVCGSRMLSKGLFQRHPNHSILQDGYGLKLNLIGRRWKCSNPDCGYNTQDSFPFIGEKRRTTMVVPFMILSSMKDLHLTCKQIAQRYNVSDSYVHDIFSRYVSLKRDNLSSVISIDEVHLNINNECKYAVVIMNFLTGDIIDIVESRRKEVMEKYWLSIPRSERDGVKYLVSDMYNPYINYASSYFHNSESIVDSFHVIQWLLKLINNYIVEVKRRYLKRDRQDLEDRNYANNRDFETQKDSREVYILKKAKWVLLMNRDNITYNGRHYNRFLDQYLDTYDWQKMFLELDDKFEKIRDLKNLYEDFNSGYINDLDGASKRLNELIDIYKTSGIDIFIKFANLLIRYRKEIINSFSYIESDDIERYHDNLRRISNGPMESFNNVPSSFKYQSRGLENFEFARNRILWSLRDDAAILGNPKSLDEIHPKSRKKRGSYNKHKDK